jgi:hypothetical protein
MTYPTQEAQLRARYDPKAGQVIIEAVFQGWLTFEKARLSQAQTAELRALWKQAKHAQAYGTNPYTASQARRDRQSWFDDVLRQSQQAQNNAARAQAEFIRQQQAQAQQTTQDWFAQQALNQIYQQMDDAMRGAAAGPPKQPPEPDLEHLSQLYHDYFKKGGKL